MKGFKRFQEITEEMGEIIKKVRKLGSSQERHFVSVSLPARAPCPDSPPLSRSTLVDGMVSFFLLSVHILEETISYANRPGGKGAQGPLLDPCLKKNPKSWALVIV